MDIKLTKEINIAIDKLEESGYLCYIVGDYIKDSLLNKKTSNIDLLTDATLEEVRYLFNEYKIVDYKKDSDTLGIIINDQYIEIESFNLKTLDDALVDKNYTINALAYSPSKGLIDYFNGIEDLKNKVLRTTKDPTVVICKNPILILKSICLEINNGFKMDKDLFEIINSRADLLNTLNPKRFKKYLDQIFLSKKPSLVIEKYFNVFSTIFPALRATYKFEQHSKWHNLDVFYHTMKVLDFTSPNLILRYAAFFHDIEKPKCFSLDDFGEGHFYNHYIDSAETAKYELMRINYSKDFINRVYNLVIFHDRRLENRDVVLKRFIHDFGKTDLDLLFELKKCDCLGQNPKLYNRLEELDLIKKRTYELLNE